jgi:ABC-2 family transporter protein
MVSEEEGMSRVATATRLGFREQARRPLVLILLVVLPVFFITRSIAVTEALPRTILLPGDGGSVVTNMRDIHGANMAAITVAFLSGLVGVFVTQSARQGDRRLVVAGFSRWQVLVPRLAVLGAATALITVVSVAVTAASFAPRLWVPFSVGTLAVGLVYGLLGVLAGTLFDRLGATYLMLFGAMLDLGIAQSPMFGSGEPPEWARALPGYGPGRVIVDAAFSPDFHGWGELAQAFAWIAALTLAVVALLIRRAGIAGNYGSTTASTARS